MNATMNPNHANVNTLPYKLIGLSAGIERAFRLTGFRSGAFHKSLTSSIFARDKKATVDDGFLDELPGYDNGLNGAGTVVFKDCFDSSHGVQDIMSNPFNPDQFCKNPSSLRICARKPRMTMTPEN